MMCLRTKLSLLHSTSCLDDDIHIFSTVQIILKWLEILPGIKSAPHPELEEKKSFNSVSASNTFTHYANRMQIPVLLFAKLLNLLKASL
jgi:hypothetical protein